MAASETTINACDISVWLDNASGTLVDISGESNALTMRISRDIGARRVFGSHFPLRKVCGIDVAIDLNVLYSTAADEALDLLRDWILQDNITSRTLVIYMPDKNVGSDMYSAEYIIENLEVPADSEEPADILCAASLLIDGTLTHSNVAT